ncbi:MAG: hypothetical protein A2007_02290 [Verrucomicrobia bacterium GWC2_42_7]|nr:MAG: hypothetical protein A2007_02290 [Verrucomicrobia bacterium GWC2_42_7]
MHKKILLCLDKNQITPFDYSQDPIAAMESMGGNSGNNIFQYALQRLLSCKDTDVTIDTSFLHVGELPDSYFQAINEKYDCLVFSPANILAEYAVNNGQLKRHIERIRKLKIPVYLIGLGAQSTKEYSFDFLESIKSLAKDFIKSVLDLNGRIGVRGAFSGEVLEQLGFSDYEVIGCPSLFCKNENLSIEKKIVSEHEFIPAINGGKVWRDPEFYKYFKKYPRSIFVCQDEFYRLLYKPNQLTWKEFQYLADEDNKWLNLYLSDRVKFYCDFPSWIDDIKRLGINFSFGSRIHGNVLPLLAGVPCFIDVIDSRIRELSEYFEIPHSLMEEEIQDPYSLYEKADYSCFNNNFNKKLLRFREFLRSCNLVINEEPLEPIESHPPTIADKQKEWIKFQSNIVNRNKLVFFQKPPAKKVAFVAHEFGFYRGHGGIASYLVNICKYLLEKTSLEVHVLTPFYDKECELLSHERFNLHDLSGKDHRNNISQQRELTFKICKEIFPEYIEFTDYTALGLHCVLAKREGREFTNTLLVTNNHTGTKEIFEWSTGLNIDKSFQDAQQSSREKTQIQCSDYCIAPSTFLGKYLKKNYNLNRDVLFFANPFFSHLERKEEIVKKLSLTMDIEKYKKSTNIVLITRFEGRKNQKALVDAFVDVIKEGVNADLFLVGNTTSIPTTQADYRLEVFKSIPEDVRERVHFYGFMSIPQQPPFVAVADLVVMPSTFENQPMAMIESVTRGLPIMASKYSGCADYTVNKDMLFDPFEKGDLAAKISKFCKLNAGERRSIAEEQLEYLTLIINPELSILPRFNLPHYQSGILNFKDLYHE